MSLTSPPGQAPRPALWGRVALVSAAHVALCTLLSTSPLGSIFFMQEDVGAAQVLAPMALGAVLAAAEVTWLGVRAAALVSLVTAWWMLVLTAGVLVLLPATADDPGPADGLLALVSGAIPTLAFTSVTALMVVAVVAVLRSVVRSPTRQWAQVVPSRSRPADTIREGTDKEGR